MGITGRRELETTGLEELDVLGGILGLVRCGTGLVGSLPAGGNPRCNGRVMHEDIGGPVNGVMKRSLSRC